MVYHKCEICNFSSKIKSHLIRHLKTKKHLNNEKNYDLNNENNKANDRSLLLIGVLSYGVFSLRTSDKDEEEKEELLENFRSGKGLELYKKNDFGVYLYQQKKLENYSAISHEEDFKKFIEPTSQILSIEYKLH